IRDHALNQSAGARSKDPIHATVNSFLKLIFPGGVQAVSGLPYVEELAAVDDIVKTLHSKDLAALVKELGVERLAKRRADPAIQYPAAGQGPAPRGIPPAR